MRQLCCEDAVKQLTWVRLFGLILVLSDSICMPQVVVCPGCARKLKAPDEYAGRKVSCPACKTVVQIPTATGSGIPAMASRQPASPSVAGQVIESLCPQCKRK